MTNPAANAFQPAINALEEDLVKLERAINFLREKTGLPPRPDGLRMKCRLKELAERLAQESNPELRDVADDLEMILKDQQP